ncbi:hypothetical protein O181_065527 [Austropuccinia psidii MF-1]|uniref:Integrase catalytic domain-containing protein n=1 Tax=Austropuccinia psidii MF-1 TaxID=1389203 RepID=A0A9Q3EXK8_9BASI|nr:hypothetical protein [Austropuccinia psidii MF-1]
MSDEKFDIDDLRADLLVSNSGAILKRQVEIDQLGEGITPRLTSDGLTFHRWYRSLNRLIERTHRQVNYFDSNEKDTDQERNAEIRSLIEKSIDASLKSSIQHKDEARLSFACLRHQFEKLSWLHVMNLFDDIVNATEALENLAEAYAATKNSVISLKSAIGSTWTDELLIAICFHHRNKKYFHEISNAMDTKVSIEKSINVKSSDILQIAQRFQKRTNNLLTNSQPSIMAASSRKQHPSPRTVNQAYWSDKSGNPPRGRLSSNCIPISQQTESWARHFLSPKFPCLHCFEWGHWAQDCPQKKAGKPEIEDPRIRNPGVTLCKSTTISHPCIAEMDAEEEEDPFVAAIESVPEDKLLVLLDSGATHHVTGDRARQHPVKGRGTIRLLSTSGKLLLKDVLHCPDIPGIVISIGKFMQNDGEVRFEGGRFLLRQDMCTYTSFLRRDQWFLLVNSTIACNAMSDSNKNYGDLLHRRLAHTSLRTIRRMQTLNCVKGLSNVPVNHDVKLCRTCSLEKSQHSPFRPESRNLVTRPGDVVVADLMGPFPQSFDKKVYGMIIQDHFSSLVTFYALKSKSEAPQFLMNWIAQFANLTAHSVKRLQTNNAGEFLSKSLKIFLEQRGIIHETIVPYEHHQAGKIERTNRTIAEAARSMLIKRSLGAALWPYAFRHACWVFNRVLHVGSDKTPYELMTGRRPDLAPLRVFGCKAFVHSLNHRKDLSAKGRELLHLGVAENSQGWIFWDKAKEVVVRSASALFDENPRGAKDEVNAVNVIEVQSVLDPTLVEEINGQDESVELISSEASNNTEAPNTYKEAMASEASNEWEAAMASELQSLEDMEVWSEVPEVQANQVLGTRWVFAVKRDPEGNIVKYKARVVVQGHRQIQGLNFDETFAPTPTFTSLQCLLAIASANAWEVQTFDVTTAYLHSLLEEDVFVKAPPGTLVL